MIDLALYGWNENLNHLKTKSIYRNLMHGRVSVVHRTSYEVISAYGVFKCELTGNIMFSKSNFELPCVGDWVIFQSINNDIGIIVDILKRERALYRKKSGTVADKQTIASYVDKAFIVQSIDNDVNIRRAERFIIQIREANIQPFLIFNKADLLFDRKHIVDAVKHITEQVPILFTSIHIPESILKLKEIIKEGESVIFVGSSGVGKSSLVNTLCNNDILKTSEISSSTSKGKHTSTRREMVLMKGSGVLIDTPGVREFGIAIEDPSHIADVLDISSYSGLCRFKNCEHINEPGCAVLEAIENGVLDSIVYKSYLKLKNEASHFTISEYEKRKQGKKNAKILEEVKKRKSNL